MTFCQGVCVEFAKAHRRPQRSRRLRWRRPPARPLARCSLSFGVLQGIQQALSSFCQPPSLIFCPDIGVGCTIKSQLTNLGKRSTHCGRRVRERGTNTAPEIRLPFVPSDAPRSFPAPTTASYRFPSLPGVPAVHWHGPSKN